MLTLKDIGIFMEILSIDSTSSKEAAVADYMECVLGHNAEKVEKFEIGDGTFNLLLSWGDPKIIFCSHMDTVPPYFPPELSKGVIRGRGSCDAKGQILAMYKACTLLASEGCTDFGLLLLAGEETGSYGAKDFAVKHPGAEYLVVGEPTDNKMVTSAKGTKAYELEFKGVPFHSGYPEHGLSAVNMFSDFMNALRSIGFPVDEELGETTWNIGCLKSDNPQNIISDRLTCRLYFRTTFASDEIVCNVMKNIAGEQAKLRFGRKKAQDGSDLAAKDVATWQKSLTVTPLGGDTPTRFNVLDGFPVTTVAFGSDAPHLTNFKKKILCGPGSILVAHTADEHISIEEMEEAVKNYIKIYKTITES